MDDKLVYTLRRDIYREGFLFKQEWLVSGSMINSSGVWKTERTSESYHSDLDIVKQHLHKLEDMF